MKNKPLKNISYFIAYMVGWTVLGVLVSFILHFTIEYPLLMLVIYNYDHYATTYLWQNWETLHATGTVLLLILGIIVGIWGGYKDYSNHV